MSYGNLTLHLKNIHSDTRYIQILRYIQENPLKTRDEINKAIYGFARRGYMSDYYGHMIAYELVDCCRATDNRRRRVYKITELGEKTLKRAEANGPMNRKKHKIEVPAVIPGYIAFSPYNYELEEDRPILDALERVLKKIVAMGAYTKEPGKFTEASPDELATREDIEKFINEEARAYRGKIRKALKNAGLIYSARQHLIVQIYGPAALPTDWYYVSEQGLAVINYLDSVGVKAFKAMKSMAYAEEYHKEAEEKKDNE